MCDLSTLHDKPIKIVTFIKHSRKLSNCCWITPTCTWIVCTFCFQVAIIPFRLVVRAVAGPAIEVVYSGYWFTGFSVVNFDIHASDGYLQWNFVIFHRKKKFFFSSTLWMKSFYFWHFPHLICKKSVCYDAFNDKHAMMLSMLNPPICNKLKPIKKVFIE